MRNVTLDALDDFDGWRRASKEALADGIAAGGISFRTPDEQASLLSGLDEHESNASRSIAARVALPPTVPKEFISLARQVVCHSHPERFSLLYTLLVRLQTDKMLMRKTVDPDVHRVNTLAKEVRRDVHKMKAFVRFRKTGETTDGLEQFVAWFEPSHHIVRLIAQFFVRRFAGMHWSILTPHACAHWNGQALSFSAGVPKSAAPNEDALEDYWRSYYASIFNPARLKIDAMTSEMPKKYWKNLPEADLIPGLIQQARSREVGMLDKDPTLPRPAMMAHREIATAPVVTARDSINTMGQLNQALHNCRACPLWRPATQVVCGAGAVQSDIMLVGEQPGDQEDLGGEPFTGPAGILLRDIMNETGMENTYITNAVKHFKFEPRGKRRIHKTPNAKEIDHCRWWLNKEVELVRPRVIVALGASAIRGIVGKSIAVSAMRGTAHETKGGAMLVATRHPSSILRTQNDSDRRMARQQLVDDLILVKALCEDERALRLNADLDQPPYQQPV